MSNLWEYMDNEAGVDSFLDNLSARMPNKNVLDEAKEELTEFQYYDPYNQGYGHFKPSYHMQHYSQPQMRPRHYPGYPKPKMSTGKKVLAGATALAAAGGAGAAIYANKDRIGQAFSQGMKNLHDRGKVGNEPAKAPDPATVKNTPQSAPQTQQAPGASQPSAGAQTQTSTPAAKPASVSQTNASATPATRTVDIKGHRATKKAEVEKQQKEQSLAQRRERLAARGDASKAQRNYRSGRGTGPAAKIRQRRQDLGQRQKEQLGFVRKHVLGHAPKSVETPDQKRERLALAMTKRARKAHNVRAAQGRAIFKSKVEGREPNVKEQINEFLDQLYEYDDYPYVDDYYGPPAHHYDHAPRKPSTTGKWIKRGLKTAAALGTAAVIDSHLSKHSETYRTARKSALDTFLGDIRNRQSSARSRTFRTSSRGASTGSQTQSGHTTTATTPPQSSTASQARQSPATGAAPIPTPASSHSAGTKAHTSNTAPGVRGVGFLSNQMPPTGRSPRAIRTSRVRAARKRASGGRGSMPGSPQLNLFGERPEPHRPNRGRLNAPSGSRSGSTLRAGQTNVPVRLSFEDNKQRVFSLGSSKSIPVPPPLAVATGAINRSQVERSLDDALLKMASKATNKPVEIDAATMSQLRKFLHAKNTQANLRSGKMANIVATKLGLPGTLELGDRKPSPAQVPASDKKQRAPRTRMSKKDKPAVPPAEQPTVQLPALKTTEKPKKSGKTLSGKDLGKLIVGAEQSVQAAAAKGIVPSRRQTVTAKPEKEKPAPKKRGRPKKQQSEKPAEAPKPKGRPKKQQSANTTPAARKPAAKRMSTTDRLRAAAELKNQQNQATGKPETQSAVTRPATPVDPESLTLGVNAAAGISGERVPRNVPIPDLTKPVRTRKQKKFNPQELFPEEGEVSAGDLRPDQLIPRYDAPAAPPLTERSYSGGFDALGISMPSLVSMPPGPATSVLIERYSLEDAPESPSLPTEASGDTQTLDSSISADTNQPGAISETSLEDALGKLQQMFNNKRIE